MLFKVGQGAGHDKVRSRGPQEKAEGAMKRRSFCRNFKQCVPFMKTFQVCLFQTRMADVGEIEVNGKIDLGTRRLVLSHVENAASFYAYLEAEKDYMDEIVEASRKLCIDLPKLTEPPILEQVGTYILETKSRFEITRKGYYIEIYLV